MSVRLHYDPICDAAYFRFSDAAILQSEEVSPGLVIDFDAEGRLVSLEVQQARRRLPKDALIAAE